MKLSMKWGLRTGAWMIGAIAVAACSGKTVDLGGQNLTSDGGGAGPGAGGATGSDSGAGGGSPGGNTSVGGGGGDAGNIVPDQPGATRSSKLDLVIMVDNSISMDDKQEVLKKTIPDLVNRLTASTSGVKDLHVGVISSSLGDHGEHATCEGNDNGTISQQEQDDHGHLITTRPRAAGLGIPQVISWDPTKSATTLSQQIQDVVTATGQFGCGLESQLESAYRFLADPKPYLTMEQLPCISGGREDAGGFGTAQQCAFPSGIDTALLAQRAAFLRPDSAVAVMILTDENDCSIRDGQQFFYAASQKVTLPHASAVCATNPNDPCCYSCGSGPPSGCAADVTCTSVPADPKEDSVNLRCFQEKRRFGLDFLNPVQRYVTAFTHTHLCTSRVDLVPSATDCPDKDHDGKPDIVANPLFSDLTGGGAPVRDPSLVYVLGLVGVPWQDLAAGGTTGPLTFKTPAQLASDGTWNVVLGNATPPNDAPPIPPTDNLMVESREPRGGNDGMGNPLAGPQVPPSQNNAINGHEWQNTGNDDLMYACIFPLAAPRDCTAVEAAGAVNPPTAGCDCGATSTPADFNPLCEDMTTGVYGHTQFAAKAYPGLRELTLLKALGNQGVTASVCPKNLTDDTQPDYGYRPAIDALITQLKRGVH